jgi:hypothetical protein
MTVRPKKNRSTAVRLTDGSLSKHKTKPSS